MRQNVLVTGANGQLGMSLRAIAGAYPELTFFFTCKEVLDIGDEKRVEAFVREHAIDAIINGVAYTAVDKAEEESEKADAINAVAVESLAKIALQEGVRLVHLSTDYVFDGKHYKPYIETDLPNAINAYGRSKQKGEEAMLRYNPRGGIILRTSWLYSPYGTNFVKTMLRLGREKESIRVVCDQVGAPTAAHDLALAIMHLLAQSAQEACQIYHYRNEGVLSWYDFAKEIMKMAKLPARIEPISAKAFNAPALRPYYGLLDTSKIKQEYALAIPYWKDSLKTCLNECV